MTPLHGHWIRKEKLDEVVEELQNIKLERDAYLIQLRLERKDANSRKFSLETIKQQGGELGETISLLMSQLELAKEGLRYYDEHMPQDFYCKARDILEKIKKNGKIKCRDIN